MLALARAKSSPSVKAAAALISGAAKDQAAMQDGPESFQPFSGAVRQDMLQIWQRVCALHSGVRVGTSSTQPTNTVQQR